MTRKTQKIDIHKSNLPLKILNSNEDDFKQYQAEALNLKLKNFGNEIWFYAPSLMVYSTDYFEIKNKYKFVPISITGTKCQLQCDHCKTKILETMFKAESPEYLNKIVRDLVINRGCEGILISGGSRIDGTVPFLDFIDVIKNIKDELGITIILHSGLVSEEIARLLAETGIDAVMLDIIGHNATIKQIYHLNRKIEDFEQSLQNLNNYKIPFVPHIILGLHYGKILGELDALRMIKKYNPASLVLLVLMPFENTPMENVKPIPPHKFARFAVISRFMFPKIPILLGCARPVGDHKLETDIFALKSGLNGIAFPCQEAIEYAMKKGYQINFSETCCSLIYKHINP